MSESDDDLTIGGREWDRMAGAVKREGFREGLSQGREESFQRGFDIGYKAGFTSGSTLGHLNGFLRFVEEFKQLKSVLDENKITYRHNEKPSRGACIICPQGKKIFTKEDMSNCEIPLDRLLEDVMKEQETCIEQVKAMNSVKLEEIINIVNAKKYCDI